MGSLKITVCALVLLFLLTLAGTLYQVSHGIYAAQEMFFRSWVVLIWGIVPFPGTVSVLLILSINLFASSIRFGVHIKKTGLYLAHAGIAILIFGAAVTLYSARESYISLFEGNETDVSFDIHTWELFLQKTGAPAPDVETVEEKKFRSKKAIELNRLGLTIKADSYYPHCKVNHEYYAKNQGKEGLRKSLLPVSIPNEPSERTPGMILELKGNNSSAKAVLYAGSSSPLVLRLDGAEYQIGLRRTLHPLPVTIKLIEFKKTYHPGSSIASNFQSRVHVSDANMGRVVEISMNRPFRYKNFTFYQSSYSEEGGLKQSTFSVMKNPARFFPYAGSLAISLGMLLHFSLKLLFVRSKKSNRK
jgi:hypothetical protein